MSATPVVLSAPPVATHRRRHVPVALLIAAASVAVALLLAYIGSNVWASVQQNRLSDRFDVAAERWSGLDPVARSSLTFALGEPVARILAPAIGLDAVAVEGAAPAIMRRAPGHLPGSATPGEEGVSIVTANRLGFGSFFLRLDRLDVGDRIVTESALGRVTYTVTEVRVVGANELDLATDSTQRVLVLFASNRLVGGADRLVVRAVAGVTS